MSTTTTTAKKKTTTPATSARPAPVATGTAVVESKKSSALSSGKPDATTVEVAEAQGTATPTAKPRTMPLMPKMKLHVEGPGKTITVAEYLAAKVKEYPKLEEGLIKGLMNKVKDGEKFEPGPLKQKAADQFTALRTQVKADFKSHAANRASWDASEVTRVAEEKAAKEKAEKEHATLLKQNQADLDRALAAPRIVKNLQLTEKAAEGLSNLSAKIKVDKDTGEIIVAEGANKSDFQEAFATVLAANSASDQLKDRSAKAEARLAFTAKKYLGDTWKELFAGRPEVESRVAKGIKIFSTVNAIGEDAIKVFNKLPLSTSRALLEMKVTTTADETSAAVAEQKNLDAKKEVLAKAAAMLDEKGSLTQTDAKNLVTNYKSQKGITAKEKFKYFHVIDGEGENMKVFGSLPINGDVDEAIVKECMLTIDSNGNRLVWISKGNIGTAPIGGPVEWMLVRIRKSRVIIDALPKGGGGAVPVATTTETKGGKKGGKASAVATPAPATDPTEPNPEDDDGDEELIQVDAPDDEQEEDTEVVEEADADAEEDSPQPDDDEDEEPVVKIDTSDDGDDGDAVVADDDDDDGDAPVAVIADDDDD